MSKWIPRIAIVAMLVMTASAWAAEPTMSARPDSDGFWSTLARHIFTFNSRGLLELFERPEFMTLAIIAINLIVFVETGLLIGFFLPGDSLLVTAGLVAQTGGWNLPLLLTTVSLSAIIGDTLGYSIGYKAGPMIFNRENSLFFKRDHLLAAQAFYEKHGGKTIILARFMPIVRTFAPVVAGVGKMEYRRFLMFNVVGGIGWVCSMILLGYVLRDVLNKMFLNVFGITVDVKDHMGKVVAVVVFLSISPGIYVWLKKKLTSKTPSPDQLTAV